MAKSKSPPKKQASGLESIVVLRNHATQERVEGMKTYAGELWKFATAREIYPSFIAVVPDNRAIVINVSNSPKKANDRDQLLGAFREEGYRMTKHNITGEDIVYSTVKPNHIYEVTIAVEGKATTA